MKSFLFALACICSFAGFGRRIIRIFAQQNDVQGRPLRVNV